MSSEKWDFSGFATKYDLKCSDGRTIRKNAFNDCDGKIVPLVWQHQHGDPTNVVGHALLKTEDAGVRAYGKFNNTEKGQIGKELVHNGDITSLSIYANKLTQKGGDVLHGVIREVSLVLSGANPGALIDYPILSHSGEVVEDEAIIYNDDETSIQVLEHSEETPEQEEKKEEVSEEKEPAEEVKHAEGEEKMAEPEVKKDDKTVKDVIDGMTEEQKTVMYFMIGQALENAKNDKDTDGGNEEMKHNVFDGEENKNDTLSHDAMEAIIGDAKRFGSMKESFIQHAADYGIENIEYLFPDAKTLNNGAPEFIKRNDEWVDKFFKATHHSPFSRIKSIFANITEEDARAKGYLKGNMKKEEFFGLIKRVTTATTVYKKQKLDREDVVDITDFDVVAWLKTEMRMMLDEEIARAALLGDGRDASSDDKINELNIRPIYTDDDLFVIHQVVTVPSTATEDDIAKAVIRAAIKARKNYKGSGNPTFWTTEDLLADMLLLTDDIGRDLYSDAAALAKKLRVKETVTVPVMEGIERTVAGNTRQLAAIIVNPVDYNIGADKGGSVNMFDDFDIDYNQQKYLIETRCSGALTKPYSAIVIEIEEE